MSATQACFADSNFDDREACNVHESIVMLLIYSFEDALNEAGLISKIRIFDVRPGTSSM